MSRNFDLQQLAHKYIPGGAHTYSRGDDQFPSNAPKILAHAKGAYVWDADGNQFLDYGMALRAVTVGYNYERISKAAIAEIEKGNNLTRASETEVMAARDLCEAIPWCEMVKFGKNGSSVVTAATKLARAFTGRPLILRCGDQPFFSYDDWFIGDTAITRGIPSKTSEMTAQFRYNDLESVKAAFSANPDQIACVVTEAATSNEPSVGFLQGLVDISHQHGAIVIFDEMITGFRWHLKGAAHHYGVIPDLVTYGKGMANGFSVAAVGGRSEIMSLGGINRPGEERVFLMSSTHGAEMCGLGAFRETMKVYKELDVPSKLWDYGTKLINGMNEIARSHGIHDFINFGGPGCSPVYYCRDKNHQISLGLRTLFIQEMIKHGILMPYIALCYEMGGLELEQTFTAADKAMKVYYIALNEGFESSLAGDVIKPVFRRFN